MDNPGVSSGDYGEAISSLDGLGTAVCNMVDVLLKHDGLAVHSVSHRVKTRESADGKLARKTDRYQDYGDLLDLLGVRIITYFPEEVDRVCEIIEEAFDIDRENSVDKRKTLEPNVFGYMSAHYVAQLSGPRVALAEYANWRGVKFEVQIRTVLQHAWAEIEHDLGYKTEGALPQSFRRRFSRLAGLLEIADGEFSSIRSDLREYAETVGQRIERAPDEVGLNMASLRAWHASSSLSQRLDAEIASETGIPLTDAPEYTDAIDSRDVGRLTFGGISSVSDVEESMARYERYVVEFAVEYLPNRLRDRPGRPKSKANFDGGGGIPPGISLFYLGYVLAAQQPDSETAEFVQKWHRSKGPEETAAKVREIKRTWNRVVKRLGAPGAA